MPSGKGGEIAVSGIDFGQILITCQNLISVVPAGAVRPCVSVPSPSPVNTEYAEDGTESFLRLAYALFLSIEWNGREADATECVPPV